MLCVKITEVVQTMALFIDRMITESVMINRENICGLDSFQNGFDRVLLKWIVQAIKAPKRVVTLADPGTNPEMGHCLRYLRALG